MSAASKQKVFEELRDLISDQLKVTIALMQHLSVSVKYYIAAESAYKAPRVDRSTCISKLQRAGSISFIGQLLNIKFSCRL